jgi:Tol biopolymer transport system component
MDEMTRFEQRFEDRVRDFALTGVRPVDSAAVAHAVAVGQSGGRGTGFLVRWLGLPLDGRAWTIALALGLLVALLGGALLAGARLLPPPRLNFSTPVTNGWIAFSVEQPAQDGVGGDLDIWLVAPGRDARRVVGSDSDRVHQLCPAFSPDGRRLAYGRVEGDGTRYSADDVERPARYRKAALVVADVTDDGRVTDRQTIDVGDGLPPPCPIWSPDGEHVAFGEPRTSPNNPETSAAGSEVWVVTLADQGITVLPDLLATDLEWAPDGSVLAIASGEQDQVTGNVLHDGRIHLYAPASGVVRTVDGTLGAVNLTWSPDSRRIAWSGLVGDGDASLALRSIDIESGHQEVLAAEYRAMHGIGPVWSPDGDSIAYQRGIGGEHSEVVLVTPDAPTDESARSGEAVVTVTARSSSERLDPYRVTWSPDGQYLLMMAWGHPPDNTGTVEDPFLVATPVDPTMPSVVLSRTDGLVVYEGYPDTAYVPVQTWGRSTPD